MDKTIDVTPSLLKGTDTSQRLAVIWDIGAEYCDRCSLALPYAFCYTCERWGYQPNGVGERNTVPKQ